MKKLLTFFLTALLAFSVGWAETTVEYTMNSSSPAQWSPGNSSGANSCTTNEGFTISCTSCNAANANYFGWNSGNTTLTISHENYTITKINFYCYDTNGTTTNVSVGSGGGTVTPTSQRQFNWETGSTSVNLKSGNICPMTSLPSEAM